MSVLDNLHRAELDVLQEFIPLKPAQVTDLLEHQAKLLALYIAQSFMPDFAQHDLCTEPRYGKSNKLLLDAEMNSAEVDLNDVMNARRRVCQVEPLPSGVPPVYKIATDLGMAEPNYVDAIMIARMGAHLLTDAQALRDAAQDGPKQQKAAYMFPGVVTDLHDPAKPAGTLIGKFEDDSRSLITAMAMHHLFQLIDALVTIDPALANAKEYTSIAKHLMPLGYLALRAGADRMAVLGHLFESRMINTAIPPGAIPADLCADDIKNALESFLEMAVAKLAKDGLIDDGQKARLESLLVRRVEQLDIRALFRPEAPQQEEGLREKLRARIKSAQ